MIEADSLSFSYNGANVLTNISFKIEEGDFVAIIGPNGSGKTTLAKLILGLLKPKKGKIRIFGKTVEEAIRSRLIGYVPQKISIDKLLPATVKEILHLEGNYDPELCNHLGVKALLHKKYVELSGGQQQRVLIAFALQRRPKVLVLDEPSTGIDIKTQKEFFQILKHINTEHKTTILLITHDIGAIPHHVKSVICVNHNICCHGPASQTESLMKKAYGHPVHVHHHHEDTK